MFLSDIENGESCLILELNLNEKFNKRLCELGVNNGVVKVIRKSYRNSPIIFLVKDTFLAIRKSDADKIVVKKV